jgi:hypothetical protein
MVIHAEDGDFRRRAVRSSDVLETVPLFLSVQDPSTTTAAANQPNEADQGRVDK